MQTLETQQLMQRTKWSLFFGLHQFQGIEEIALHAGMSVTL